ncbi:MAG: deoxynucleoside kinase [Mycoplasma sp.]|nr:deoxynucleoside kinase [Mycoplasma sp.]
MELNNLIIIGGQISAGKSTLIEKLELPFVPELDENNPIQKLILKATYTKYNLAPIIVEMYFLKIREKYYKKHAANKTTTLLDRSIFESLWFAKKNLPESDKKFFRNYWQENVESLVKEFGKPKLYLLLVCDWDTFKKRIHKRSRKIEIENFNKNATFFQEHILNYQKDIKKILDKFEINYKVIDTSNMNEEEVYEVSKKYIDEVK